MSIGMLDMSLSRYAVSSASTSERGSKQPAAATPQHPAHPHSRDGVYAHQPASKFVEVTPRRPRPPPPPLPPRPTGVQALAVVETEVTTVATTVTEVPDAKKGFYRVADRMYVGCRPDIARFEELHRLGVRHIISLEDGWSVNQWGRKREYRLAGTRDMLVIDRPLSPFWPVRWSRVSDVIHHMTDRKRQPIYVHCFYGQERALFLAGLIRVYYDGWTPERAFDEMRSFGYRPWLVPMLTHQYWRWSRSPSKRAKMKPTHSHPSRDELLRTQNKKTGAVVQQKTLFSRVVHRLFIPKAHA